MIHGSANSPVSGGQDIEAFLAGKSACKGCCVLPTPQVIARTHYSHQAKNGISAYAHDGVTQARKFSKQVVDYNRDYNSDDDPSYIFAGTATTTRRVAFTITRVDPRAGSPIGYSAETIESEYLSTNDLSGTIGPCTMTGYTSTHQISSADLIDKVGGFAPNYSFAGSGTQTIRTVKNYTGEGCTEEDTDDSVVTAIGAASSDYDINDSTIISPTVRQFLEDFDSGSISLEDEVTDAIIKNWVDDDLDGASTPATRLEVSSTATYVGKLWEFIYADNAAYLAAIAARVAIAEAALATQESTLSDLQDDLADAEQDLEDAENALANYAALKATAESARAEQDTAASAYRAAQAKYQHDSTLSDVERAALLVSTNALQATANEKQTAYEAALSEAQDAMDEGYSVAVAILDHAVELAEHKVAVQQLNVTDATAAVASATANTSYTQYTYSPHAAASWYATPNVGVGDYWNSYTKRAGSYRLQVGLAEYTHTAAAEVKVSWREKTTDSDGDVTWVSREATVTAAQGAVYAYTDWYTVSPVDGSTVELVGPAPRVTATATYIGGGGGSIARYGFIDFSADGLLKTYRRISFGGGYAGSTGIPARDYTGHKELGENASEDITEETETAWTSWPLGIKARMVEIGHEPFPLRVIATPDTETATSRTFSRQLGGVEETFTMTLSDEVADADLLAELDGHIAAETTTGQGKPTWQGLSPEVCSICTVTDREVYKYQSEFRLTVDRKAALDLDDEDLAAETVSVPVLIGEVDIATGVITEEEVAYEVEIAEGDRYGNLDLTFAPVLNKFRWIKEIALEVEAAPAHGATSLLAEGTVDPPDYGLEA